MRIKFKFAAILYIMVLAFSCSSYKQDGGDNIFAFTHVNVIPMNKEMVLKDYTVIIQNGVITKLGSAKSLKVPEKATIIESKGKYLIPGLSDMHVHLEGDAWNIMYKPESKFTKEQINFDDILFLYIANGITTIDVMFAFPEHIELREKINNNEILGPQLVLSKMIDGAGKAWPPPLGTWVNNAKEAKSAVIEAHKLGFDRIKVYSFLDKESYDSIITTAKGLNIPVDGHIPLSTSVEHVIASGQNMITHSEEIMKFAKDYTPEQIEYFASFVANSHTWLTATLTTSNNLISLFEYSEQEFSKTGTQYLHPMGTDIWNYIYNNLYKNVPQENRNAIHDGYKHFQIPFTYEFYKKGGKLLIGTDALIPSNVPGFSLHEELEQLVNIGLSPFEALKVSTTNTHEFLGELEIAGTIESGKKANLVLLDENPLERISNTKRIIGVMTHNQWISKKEIDQRLVEISISYSQLKKDRLNQK